MIPESTIREGSVGRHIAIDIRNIGRHRTGSESVVVALVRSLIHAQHDHHIHLITDTQESSVLAYVANVLDFSSLTPEARSRVSVHSLWAPHRFLWILWSVPRFVRRFLIDTFHTEYIVPFFLPRRVRVATHIHDVSFAVPSVRPMISRKDLAFLDVMIPRSLRRADIVIAVSAFTRDQIVQYYPDVAHKVVQIDNACSEKYIARTKELQKDTGVEYTAYVREKYGLPQHYIFSLGTMQPRKNIAHAIEAFARFAQEVPDLHLVIGGQRAYHFDQSIDRIVASLGATPAIADRIVFTGYIADDDLPHVYRLSAMCIVPSLYEGFGVPLLEAMWANVPVVCSDIPVFREVAGDSALYFPVGGDRSQAGAQIDQCARAIYTVWSDAQKRSELVVKAQKRRDRYSWHRSGFAFLSALEGLYTASNTNMKNTFNSQSPQGSRVSGKKPWKKIALFLFVLTLICVGAVVWRVNALSQAVSQKSIWDSIGKRVAGEELVLKGQDSGRINIAIVGMRGYGVVGGGLLADTIMVVSIIENGPSYKVSALSVPRDLLVEGPDGRLGKINTVYFYGEKQQVGGGGIEAMKTVLGKVTGAPIHYGVAINFEGFSQIVDALGGVDVALAEEFVEPLQFNQVHVCDGDNGGVFTVPTGETQKKFGKNGKITAEYPLCHNSSPECGGIFRVDKGDQVLSGADALCYVRSRMTSSDFDRARRQQDVLDSLRTKATSLNLVRDFGRLNEILSIVGDNVEFDMELWELDKLFGIYQQLDDNALSQTVLDDGQDGFLYAPDEEDGYDSGFGYILRPRDDTFGDIHALFASFADDDSPEAAGDVSDN